MSTDEDDEPEGTLILADVSGEPLQWHHSIAYDAEAGIHTTACGREIHTDDIHTVELEPREGWYRNVRPTDGCPTCHKTAKGDVEASVNEDGAVEHTDDSGTWVIH